MSNSLGRSPNSPQKTEVLVGRERLICLTLYPVNTLFQLSLATRNFGKVRHRISKKRVVKQPGPKPEFAAKNRSPSWRRAAYMRHSILRQHLFSAFYDHPKFWAVSLNFGRKKQAARAERICKPAMLPKGRLICLETVRVNIFFTKYRAFLHMPAVKKARSQANFGFDKPRVGITGLTLAPLLPRRLISQWRCNSSSLPLRPRFRESSTLPNPLLIPGQPRLRLCRQVSGVSVGLSFSQARHRGIRPERP